MRGCSDGTAWDGEDYQRRFDALAAQGRDVHGEAAFVAALGPASVLDLGCGSGRVAVELDRRGIEVVGADPDASMLATARGRAPHLRWIEADGAGLDLDRRFDVVVMAGNVPLFTPPDGRPGLVAGAARHLAPDGVLVAGFSLGRGYGTDDYDADATAAGLVLARRFATWDGDPFVPGADYAVSVHGHRAAI
jgi:SAM-dependent methyltransferase